MCKPAGQADSCQTLDSCAAPRRGINPRRDLCGSERRHQAAQHARSPCLRWDGGHARCLSLVAATAVKDFPRSETFTQCRRGLPGFAFRLCRGEAARAGSLRGVRAVDGAYAPAGTKRGHAPGSGTGTELRGMRRVERSAWNLTGSDQRVHVDGPQPGGGPEDMKVEALELVLAKADTMRSTSGLSHFGQPMSLLLAPTRCRRANTFPHWMHRYS